MIGRLTDLALTASMFGLTSEQMNWPQDPDSYADLRSHAQELLDEMELDLEVPATQEEYLEARLPSAVMFSLSSTRGRVLGDTVALPLFLLHSMALRAVVYASLGTGGEQERSIVQDCLEDLGLDRDLVTNLDREAGWVVLYHDGDEGPNVRHVDLLKATGSFIARVLEEFARTQGGDDTQVLDELRELARVVGDFRDEQRQANAQIERLVREGNEELLAAMGEIEATLVAQGVPADDATELVEADPGKLWDRVVRWFSGTGPRDAAEEALWAALDFVPAGTGVKLGIKVAKAIRDSLKKSAKSGPAARDQKPDRRC